MRDLKGPWSIIFGSIGMVWCLFLVYTAYTGAFHPIANRAIFAGFALIMCFALFPLKKDSLQHRPTVPDIIVIIVGLIPVIFAIINEETFLLNVAQATPLDLVLAVILILVIFEAGRRSVGIALPIIVICVYLYGYLGYYMPGYFKHPSISWERMLDTTFRTDYGLWGSITGIGATVIGIFVIFSGTLTMTGGGDCLRDLALRLTGKYRGGAGMLVPVMDIPIGTVSGSAVVSVVASGVFTIPLMKKVGYSPKFAGAVEAVSSTGAQLDPPVMGAAAFLMAEITGIPYVDICIAAIIPSVIFYIIVLCCVYFEARRLGLGSVPAELIPTWRKALINKGFFPIFLPLAVLIYFMAGGYSISYACFWAMVSGVGIYALTSPSEIPKLPALLWKAMNEIMGTLVTTAIVVLLASIVVGLTGATGLGVALSGTLVEQSGMSVLASLILSAIVLIILGMGMPTAACYAVGAAILGPVLLSLKVPMLPAHFFIFYCCLMSAITPPVAAAVYPACALAESEFWPTAWTSCRVGAGLFLLPFAFVYTPDLLLGVTKFSIWGAGLAFLRALLVAIFVSAGAIGWLLIPFKLWQRILFVAAGIILIIPNVFSNLAGFLVGVFVLLSEVIYSRRKVALRQK